MSKVSKPKLWRDMTDEEKGALLLAHHEGEVIETLVGETWHKASDSPRWSNGAAYRVKPDEPVRETVEGWWDGYFHNGEPVRDYYRITFDTINGEPDCASIKMEKL